MRLITLFTLLIVLAAACRKNEAPELTPQQSGKVSIGGSDYTTALIGNQLWTIENYSGEGGRAYDQAGGKAEYGKYYTLSEMRAIKLPAGWRIPSTQDYINLAQGQGIVLTSNRAQGQQAIKNLVSLTNWRSVSGTNVSGFNGQPGGYCFQEAGPQDGDIAEFWTSEGNTMSIQENAAGQAHNLGFYNNSDSPDYRFNVRFVRDK